jgi:transposase
VDQELNPRIQEAKSGERELFFVDASHFVLMAYLGYLWCLVRVFLKTPSGRQRYNVLGAFNAITHELITVTNTTYINAHSVIELISKICEKYKGSVITLVMDNARYQKCRAVTDFAKENGVELLFLPPYSPNLNLIERLWKYVKKECMYNKYYDSFKSFKYSIDECLNNINGNKNIESLMTLKFQVFQNAS